MLDIPQYILKKSKKAKKFAFGTGEIIQSMKYFYVCIRTQG